MPRTNKDKFSTATITGVFKRLSKTSKNNSSTRSLDTLPETNNNSNNNSNNNVTLFPTSTTTETTTQSRKFSLTFDAFKKRTVTFNGVVASLLSLAKTQEATYQKFKIPAIITKEILSHIICIKRDLPIMNLRFEIVNILKNLMDEYIGPAFEKFSDAKNSQNDIELHDEFKKLSKYYLDAILFIVEVSLQLAKIIETQKKIFELNINSNLSKELIEEEQSINNQYIKEQVSLCIRPFNIMPESLQPYLTENYVQYTSKVCELETSIMNYLNYRTDHQIEEQIRADYLSMSDMSNEWFLYTLKIINIDVNEDDIEQIHLKEKMRNLTPLIIEATAHSFSQSYSKEKVYYILKRNSHGEKCLNQFFSMLNMTFLSSYSKLLLQDDFLTWINQQFPDLNKTKKKNKELIELKNALIVNIKTFMTEQEDRNLLRTRSAPSSSMSKLQADHRRTLCHT